jgi:hypothetical protein
MIGMEQRLLAAEEIARDDSLQQKVALVSATDEATQLGTRIDELKAALSKSAEERVSAERNCVVLRSKLEEVNEVRTRLQCRLAAECAEKTREMERSDLLETELIEHKSATEKIKQRHEQDLSEQMNKWQTKCDRFEIQVADLEASNITLQKSYNEELSLFQLNAQENYKDIAKKSCVETSQMLAQSIKNVHQNFDQTLAVKNQELDKLRSRLSQVDISVSALKNKIHQDNNIRESLILELKAEKQISVDAVNKNSLSEEALNTLMTHMHDEATTANAQLSTKTQDYILLEQKLNYQQTSHNEELNSFREQVSELKLQISQAEGMIVESNTNLHETSEELNSSKHDNNVLRATHVELTDKLQLAIQTCDVRLNELLLARQQISETIQISSAELQNQSTASADAIKMCSNELKRVIITTTSERESFELEIAKLSSDCNDYKTRISDLETAMMESVREHQVKEEELQDRLALTATDAMSAKTELSVMNDSMNTLEAEYSAIQCQLAVSNDEKTAFVHQTKLLKNEIENIVSARDNALERINALSTQVADDVNRISGLQIELNESTELLSIVKNRFEVTTERLETVLSQLDTYKRETSSAQEMTASYSTKLNEATSCNLALQQSQQTDKNKIDTLKKNIEQMNKTLDERKNDIIILEQDRCTVQDCLSNIISEYHTATANTQRLEQELDNSARELSQFRSDSVMNMELKESLSLANEEKNKIFETLESTMNQIDVLNTSIKKMEIELINSNTNSNMLLGQQKEQFALDISQRDNSITKLENTISGFTVQIRKFEAAKELLRASRENESIIKNEFRRS